MINDEKRFDLSIELLIEICIILFKKNPKNLLKIQKIKISL